MVGGPQEHWVARPGDLIRLGHEVHELATRVGGLPVYPADCSAPETAMTACHACGQQLALLLQAHAPLTSEQTGGAAQARRLLYVFGCTAEGCGKQPGCWRALRVTAPDSPGNSTAAGAQQAALPAPASGTAAAAEAAAAADDWGVGSSGGADDWGVGGGSDWGDEASSGTNAAAADAAFDFGDLNAALEAVGSTAAAATAAAKPAATKTAKQSQQQQAAGGCSAGTAGPAYDAARPSLPAFYLYSEPESECSGSQGQAAEQQHLQQLLARYEQEAAAAGEAAAAAASSAAAAAAACSPSIEGGPESWGGEGYEEDAVLAPGGGKKAGVGAAYLKFSRQLARCPDQCARYSFGGAPLWPGSQPPEAPPPCGACGGARVFELQLMTPLIHGLTESAEWLAAGTGSSAAAAGNLLQPSDSWEWLTLCVYTCRANCCGDAAAAAAVVEEAVVAANEE